MDFSQVKSLTIPEGEVTKIEIGGVTVWEKAGSGVNFTLTYFDSGVEASFSSNKLEDFQKLCSISSSPYTFRDGTIINKSDVKWITINECPDAIGNGFMAGTALEGDILWGNTLTIPDNVTSIGNYFLYGCNLFNSSVTIPSSVTSIGNSFLQSCSNFNKALTIPSSVTHMGESFLSGCTSLNSTITFNCTIDRINAHFMDGCKSFSRALTTPRQSRSSTVPGDYFMYNCNSFVGPLTLTFLPLMKDTGGTMLGTTSSSAPMYKTGVTIDLSIIGSTVWSTLHSMWPDRTAVPYRKLVKGS